MQTVAILGTRYPDFSVEEEILAPLAVRIVGGAGATADEIAEIAGDAAVILAGSGPRFDAATLERLTCRGIVRNGVGVETVDLAAARRAGIWVARVADYGTEAVAFHAVTLALAGVRRLLEADRRVRAGRWGFAELRPLHLPSALVAGVVGFGRIGRRAAELLLALGFEVLAYDPVAPVGEPRVRRVALAELLERADVVTLHAPAPEDGSPLLAAPELGAMRPGAVLVNTSRGSLVDEAALVAGLRAGRPGTAALDVYFREPLDPSVFADVSEHVILTPHMAWYTEESEHDLRVKAAQEARRLLEGERPRDVVVEPETVRT
jgi:D-3-phosphoglycerate dehydrogenase